ncbi:MAG TPA: hypothetical protein VKH19_15365 [Gemmatimonadaceae bacterium]|nr:hypothetical protein [Gemmatimonadaceae bacterium]
MRWALLALPLLVAACDRRKNLGANADEGRVLEAMPKIEEVTGLKFKSQPKLERRSRAQVREFLLAKFNESTPAEQLKNEEMAYKLFGLIPDTLDLRAFLLELLTEQIVGYYDPATKVLYVVQDAPDDLLGVTVTHELVHALQDQYVNLDSIQKLKGNSDRQAAAQAVMEGHATYEQMEIMVGGNVATRLPGGWDQIRQTIREAQSSMPVFANAPMAIQESLLFPYLSGAEFVRRFESHRKAGTVLDSLPTSTEQILSEQAYFGTPRDEPTDVALPAGVGSASDETMGEFGTRLFLYQHSKDITSSSQAADGWDGDRYRVVPTERGPGIVWVTVWDTPTDAAQFVDAMGQAIGKRYATSAPTVNAAGVRTYSGRGRTVVISPVDLRGRPVVAFVDVPAGARTAVLDFRKITVGP